MAVLGATGAVGQKFIRLLDGHPRFRVNEVVASDKSAGRPYGEVSRWLEETPLPAPVAKLSVAGVGDPLRSKVVFSALPSGEAGPVERRLAAAGHRVFTNAADLRMEPDVPLVIGEVNPDHLDLVARQRNGTGKKAGFVVANGNCTAILLALALKPLDDAFGVKRVHVVTMQSLSGAGYPGVSGLDATENVVPFIRGEEEKVEREPQKFLGHLEGGSVAPAPFSVSATCTRVPVIDGHTEAVTVELARPATADRIVHAWNAFRGEPQRRNLPSAPKHAILYRGEPDRPQPRKDRAAGNGMTLTIGRLRPDPHLGWKFVITGSNTVRGAAGGAILNAELAAARGLI